ncbi:hypothetical protein JCM10207_006396 [Rhodosporidiobolus poonsookiae]
MPAERSNDPKTRSRAGCLTCRSRHKKCDETRLPEHGGNCRRCFAGSWECRWPVPPSERPLKQFVKAARPSRAKGGRKSSSGDIDVDEASPGDGFNSSSSSNGTGSAPSAGPGFAVPPFLVPPPGAAAFAPPYPNAFTSPTTGHALLSSAPLLLPPTPRPPTANANASPSFSYATLAPAAAPTPGSNSYPTPSGIAAAPSATPNGNGQFSDLDLLAPLPHLSLKPGEDLTDFFASLDAELGSWESALGSASAHGSTSDSPAFATRSPGGGLDMSDTSPAASGAGYSSGLTPAFSGGVDGATPPIVAAAALKKAEGATGLPGEKTGAAGPLPVLDASAKSKEEMQERGYLDLEYNTFNDGFFRSLPKPVRDVVCKNVYNVVVSSELSRNAGMAMVMLYRLRMQQQQQQTNPSEDPDPAVTAEQQARLLAQSNAYFQRALEHIQTPIPFEAKMVSILDMQAFQFDQWGAAAANAIVLLGEYFVNEELGSQPNLDLKTATVILSSFAWTDAIRTLCIPGRRTVFNFTHLPGDPDPSQPTKLITDVSTIASEVQVHLGLPVGLMLCLAAIANLSAEMDALPDEVVRVKADAIEKAVRGWRSPVPDAQDLAEGAAFMEKLSTAEMWRWALIIFLYQAVHKHGSLSRVIRDSMQQILTVGSTLLSRYQPPVSSLASLNLAAHTARNVYGEEDGYHSAPATRAVPWFLAGTVAHLPQDRALCRKGLEACGPMLGYRDNLQALERVWEVVEEKGWAIDWRVLLQAEKRFVGFL